ADPARVAGARARTLIMRQALEVDLECFVHEALTLKAALTLGVEIGVLFGASGAGKTTLLRLIAGLQKPARGYVRSADAVLFDSASHINLPLRLRRIGMIFQDDLLFPHLSVGQNICFGLNGQPKRQAMERLDEIASLCSVEHLLCRRPETLSGGERQRVGLARALAPRPRLLLCDEPVSALDLASRHALIARIRTVQQTEGIPLLYVTHSPAEAIALGSRLFLLSAGTIIDEGPPLDVLARRPGPAAHLEGVRNLFAARVESHAADGGETHLRLDDGPTLIVPYHECPADTRVNVEILAADILLARGPIVGLSARNLIAGTVERIVPHGPDAEVVVRTGGICWIASVVFPAVTALDLKPGADVWLVLKARSCRVLA
ncbi:MAG: ATP-binding cassette domain-containing protein, partial [Isosphaeraceae bacterium]|nr:ATP-binding cassette domain-containing protein [Isosphaeraceae bacterium]